MMCEDCEGPCSRRTEDEPEQQQPKEYIITEKQVVSLEHSKSSWARVVASEVRCCPAPTIPCQYSADDDMCLECKVHEERIATEAARKAREDVLKIIAENKEEIIKRLSEPFSPDAIKEMKEIVRKHESLRTATTPQQTEPCKGCTDPNQCYVPCKQPPSAPGADAVLDAHTIEVIWEHIKEHSDPMTDDYFAALRQQRGERKV